MIFINALGIKKIECHKLTCKEYSLLLRKKNNKNITQINLFAIVFAGIFAFLSASFIVVNEYMDFQNEMKILEKNYLEGEKKRLSLQMDLLSNIVEYRLVQSSELPKEEFYLKLKEDIRYLTSSSEEKIYIFVHTKNGDTIYTSPSYELYHTSKDIVFTKEYPPLDLILGSGVNIGNIEDVLAQKNKDYDDKIISFMIKIYILTLFLYLISTLEYRYVSEIMKKEIRFIVESFQKASKNYETIEVEKINFKEFCDIASHANIMLAEVKEKTNALVELNINLEGIVEQKTQELKKSVDFAKELLEKQDRFVKNAIHEINTPLSIILMNIDLYNLKFEKNKYLQKIEAAVKVLDNIYEDLEYIAKKDRVVYEKSVIDFSKFALERIEYFEDVAICNKVTIKNAIRAELFVVFNEIELQRICDNNISNAIKYSFENTSVHVRLYAKNASIVFEVENRGEMIKAPEKLFSRYYREDVARGGFGLGLNIVKEICDENNVFIEVISNEESTMFRYVFNKG